MPEVHALHKLYTMLNEAAIAEKNQAFIRSHLV